MNDVLDFTVCGYFLGDPVDWVFGGGSPGTATGLGGEVHTVSFFTPGSYSVSAVADGSIGSGSITVIVATSPTVTIKSTITADNDYIFGYGSANEMTCKPPVFNTEASQIFGCAGPES